MFWRVMTVQHYAWGYIFCNTPTMITLLVRVVKGLTHQTVNLTVQVRVLSCTYTDIVQQVEYWSPKPKK